MDKLNSEAALIHNTHQKLNVKGEKGKFWKGETNEKNVIMLRRCQKNLNKIRIRMIKVSWSKTPFYFMRLSHGKLENLFSPSDKRQREEKKKYFLRHSP